MRAPFISLVFAVSSLGAACTTVSNDPADDPGAGLDRASFACTVEPILARDCSYTGCHGNPAFPLRVYSVGKLRAGSMKTLDDRIQPLADGERAANFESAAAFAYGGVAPDDNLLLRKAMPAEHGGYEHIGGAIFDGPDDPRARVIRAWLAGARGCPGGTP